jgi:hypothetical protein
MKDDRPDSTDLTALIAAIEAAGYDWAVGGGRGYYIAAVERHPSLYIGETISGPRCQDGTTPHAALYASAKEEGGGVTLPCEIKT